jgi:DNA-binding CsgD family transcriptional regulator
MYPQKRQIQSASGSKTYPLGEAGELSVDGHAMALVALSHTQLEQKLYSTMLSETSALAAAAAGLFSTRQLMTLTNIRSSGTVRRGIDGLVAKLSIERQGDGRNGSSAAGRQYVVHSPEAILARRKAQGVAVYPKAVRIREGNQYFERAIKRVVANGNLSRREAQVALCCVEGLTNAEIGNRLSVTEQTVKFHLRHIFIKFSVKRRAELISLLLM